MLKDFLHLFFPDLCAACSGTLLQHEQVLCSQCYVHLPKTGFHSSRGNEAEQIFYGRIPVTAVASYYYFNRGSHVQELLHRVKYQNLPEAAAVVGEWYGRELKKVMEFSCTDFILPVPLHPKKLKERGYNQSSFFAKGLSRSMGIPIAENWLYRKIYKETQTKKDKFSRVESVEEVFDFHPQQDISGKQLLIVDDVLTTGATLEACANAVLKTNDKIKISMATLAYAQR